MKPEVEGMDPVLGAVGVVVSFALAMVLVIRRLNYGLALAVGGVVLAAFFGMTAEGLLQVALHTVTDREVYYWGLLFYKGRRVGFPTLELALAVALIPVLAHCLQQTRMMAELIDGLKGRLSPRAILAAVPAVFGLLPMTGGALLSAPLIDGEAERLGVSPEGKSVINLWFRHWAFFVSPLAPTLILAARLTGVNLYTLILANAPVFTAHVVLGYLFIIRPIGRGESGAAPHTSRAALLTVSAPLVTVVALSVLGVPLYIALALGILLTAVLGRTTPGEAARMVREGFQWRLVAAILGIMFFRYVMRDSGADSFIRSGLAGAGVPPILLLTAVPLLFGAATANPEVSVAMSISLVLPMFGDATPPIVSLMYIGSIVAYNLSPLHLCLVLTVGYYKPRVHGVYRRLTPLFAADYLIGLLAALAMMRL